MRSLRSEGAQLAAVCSTRAGEVVGLLAESFGGLSGEAGNRCEVLLGRGTVSLFSSAAAAMVV